MNGPDLTRADKRGMRLGNRVGENMGRLLGWVGLLMFSLRGNAGDVPDQGSSPKMAKKRNLESSYFLRSLHSYVTFEPHQCRTAEIVCLL